MSDPTRVPAHDGWIMESDKAIGSEREVIYRHAASGRGIWVSILPTTADALSSNGEAPEKITQWPHDVQVYDGPADSDESERIVVGGFGDWPFVLGQIAEAMREVESDHAKAGVA